MSTTALTAVDATDGVPRGTLPPRRCDTCDVEFVPRWLDRRRPAPRFCSKSCAEIGKRSEIEELLPDDLIWRRRNLPIDVLHPFAPAFPLNSISQNLLRRGYTYESGSRGTTHLSGAPCRDCGRKRVPVSLLNDRRQCRLCRPLFLLPTERAS